MAKVLPDREIKKLIGSVIVDGDPGLLNPNGIELRLGDEIRFISTGEIKEIPGGCCAKLAPGESAVIVSLEKLDFSKKAVQAHYPNRMLMALITPTTTMMREGITHAATKVDAGFVGQLNWGLRNSSHKDVIIQRGEPIFKLTFMLLEPDEVPENPYGSKAGDKYQNTDGILVSARKVPADIPQSKLIGSSLEKIDPKTSLREAGFPFTHIGSELIRLDGKFEIVSNDMLVLKEQLGQLTTKIERETAAVVSKVDESTKAMKEHTEHLFSRKILGIGGFLLGAAVTIWGALTGLQARLTNWGLIGITAGLGIVILVLTWFLCRRIK